MDDARKWSNRHYIELDFFAGAPNPRWEISPADAEAFVRRISRLDTRERHREFLEPNSWYGGVILHLAGESGPGRYLTIFGEHVFDSTTDTVLFDPGRTLERALYEAAPAAALEFVERLRFDQAIVAVNENMTVLGARTGALPNCPDAPAFEEAPPPVRWDTSPGRDDNNCYNYANDVFSQIDDALPGGVLRHQWTESEMHDLLVGDGLFPVTPDRKKLPNGCDRHDGAHLIAVCLRRKQGTRLENGVQVDNFRDFHCFRLDTSRVWSHKDGRKKATNLDNRNNKLTDLSDSRFKLVHHLVGYYWTFPGPHRKIRTP